MRVAIVTPYFGTPSHPAGGVGSHYAQLVRRLAPLVESIDLVVPAVADIPDSEKAALAPNVTFHWLPMGAIKRADPASAPARASLGDRFRRSSYNLSLNARVLRELRRLQRTVGFDIVETTNYNYPCLFYSLVPGARPIVTRVSTTMRQLRTTESGKSDTAPRLIDYLEVSAIRRSAALVTHTRRHAREISGFLRVDESQFRIIPHGIDIPSAPAPYPSDEKFSLLFVGHLIHRKGIDTLLECVPGLCSRFPNLVIRIAGRDDDGNVERSFRRTRAGRYAEQVHFLGELVDEQLVREFICCHAMVVPSRYESFGLVYVEAMSHGRIPIGTTAGGIPEVIDDGKTGILVEPGNARALEGAIEGLLRDRPLRLRMAQAAFEAANSRFNSRTMAEETHSLYEAVLAKG